jgi:hypothetical protein
MGKLRVRVEVGSADGTFKGAALEDPPPALFPAAGRDVMIQLGRLLVNKNALCVVLCLSYVVLRQFLNDFLLLLLFIPHS